MPDNPAIPADSLQQAHEHFASHSLKVIQTLAESTQHSLDAWIFIMSSIITLGVIASGAFIYYLIGKTKKEILDELGERIDEKVDLKFRQKMSVIDEKMNEATERVHDFENIVQDTKSDVAFLKEIKGQIERWADPNLDYTTMYNYVFRIAKKAAASEEERGKAKSYLNEIIRLGLKGFVDATSLYNSASNAGHLAMDKGRV